MAERRFEIRFAAQAYKEYEELDNSVVIIVDKKLEDLEKRADEIGTPLKGNLSGYREIKLRDAGIRIIYQITEKTINILKIVYILAINKRAAGKVFRIALQRQNLDVAIEKSTAWEKKNKKRK